ncbi:MAG: glycosyltransferase family 1 protein [bacterium]|nr:glycosyltransferase family 1 protein [bacterium]
MRRDLIYLSPIPWRGLYQRPQHTARLLARDRNVLFVEPITIHGRKPPKDEGRLSFLALPVLPINARNPLVRGMASFSTAIPPLRRMVEIRQSVLLCRKLDKLVLDKRFSIEGTGPAFLFGYPQFYPLKRTYPEAPLIYDHMDDILHLGNPSAAMRRDFTELVSRADLVNATSGKLAEQMTAMKARKLLRIGNGVEWARFTSAGNQEPPVELVDLPQPRVIYVGSVAEWFDFDLLFEVARLRPEISFPIVGPVRPQLKRRINAAPANVHFFGARPYEEIPTWLAGCRAAMIPFLKTPLTEAVDPVKIHEYLASGLGVLTTSFSPEVLALAGPVTAADTASEFAAALDTHLASPPDPEQQRSFAAGRRWDALLAELAEALDQL